MPRPQARAGGLAEWWSAPGGVVLRLSVRTILLAAAAALLLIVLAFSGLRNSASDLWRTHDRGGAGAAVADGGFIGSGRMVDPHGPKYLLPSTWNNLCNQRLSVMRALVVAKELGLTLVLPRWHLNWADYPPFGTPDLAPFDYFYSSDALAALGRAQGFRVVKELPAHLWPACASQLQHSWATDWSVRERPDNGSRQEFSYDGNCPSVGNLTAALLDWSNAYGVACLTGKCSFHVLRPGTDDRKLLSVRGGFQVSALFQGEVEAILAALEARFGTRDFVSVHARTEADWKSHCPWAEKHWAYGYACYVGPEEIARYLEPRVPHGALVFLATGDPLSDFPLLCQLYRCWKRETVKPALGPGIINKSTSRAFLDLLLAARGTAFFGNKFSSFTAEVNEEFQLHNPSYDVDLVQLYNPLLNAPPLALDKIPYFTARAPSGAAGGAQQKQRAGATKPLRRSGGAG